MSKELDRAINILRDLSSSIRKNKTAFMELVDDGVIDTSTAQEYMEELNDTQPEVAQHVAQVLKRKSASVGFGQVANEPRKVNRKANSNRISEVDEEFLNLDFGG